MSSLTYLFGQTFHWVLQTTWKAAALAGLILLAQWLLRERLSPAWRHRLWLLLVVRLLMPVPPPSAFSIFNLTRATPSRPIAPSDALATIQSPLAASHVRRMDWFDLAMYSWLAGVCFFGARLAWTNGRFRARIAGYQPVTDEEVMRIFNECRRVFKITRPIHLVECEEVEGPAVYGIWRKWLLLPDGIFERYSTEELRYIFLHELAHVKRGDLDLNWLFAGLQMLHWFNPVLWLAWRRMRADREMATDTLALAHAGEGDRAPYGETVLKVLEGLTSKRALPELVGIVESKAQLKERLAAISHPGRYWKSSATAVALLIACIGLTNAQTKKGGMPDSAATSPSDPAGITGTWRATEVAFAPWTFNLKAVGATVTGTVSQGQKEGASHGTMTTTLTDATPIYNGVIAGNKVSFECDMDNGGRTISFWGLLAGDTIKFTRAVKVRPNATAV